MSGHESLGYFADRYGLTLVGAVIPSASSQAEASAGELAALREAMKAVGADVIFTEVGTPPEVVDAIARRPAPAWSSSEPQPPRRRVVPYVHPRHRERLRLGARPVIEPFLDNEFLQRALLAGILVSIACSVVGTYVVLRGLAFIGDALAHGVLPGVAGALLLGWPGMLGAAVGAVAMIGGVGLITTKSRLSSDTAIGLLFVGLLALGVVMVSRSDSFTGDLVTILFGELLGIGTNDLVIQAVATLVVVVVGLLLARPFLLLCFDPDLAQVMGYPSRRYHNVMLALIAATVIVSFQTVGTLLVFGMLLAPAGVGALVSRRVGVMMVVAGVTGVLSTYLGLLASYHWNFAAGASVVLCAVAIFFVTFAATAARDAMSARAAT